MNERGIIDYCLSLPHVYEVYPYGPQYAVMQYIFSSYEIRFAVVYERGNKLYIELRCAWHRDITSQVFDDVMPGYRMHKDTWDTIAIGDNVGEAELFFAIRSSYEFVKPRLREHNKTLVTWGKPWPVNFYCSVFGLLGESYPDMPKDAEKTVELVLDMFTRREKEIFLARYKEYMVFSEIGAAHCISGNRVWQIHNNIIRKIRRSPEIMCLIKDNAGIP